MRFLAIALLSFALAAQAQQKEIKIGFIYDVSGPFAGGGSEPAQAGTKGSSYGPREQGTYAREFYTTVKTAYTNPG